MPQYKVVEEPKNCCCGKMDCVGCATLTRSGRKNVMIVCIVIGLLAFIACVFGDGMGSYDALKVKRQLLRPPRGPCSGLLRVPELSLVRNGLEKQHLHAMRLAHATVDDQHATTPPEQHAWSHSLQKRGWGVVSP